MPLKNIILCFGLTLYFLQCQGAFITPGEFALIRKKVKEYKRPEGICKEENGNLTINLLGIRDIIIEVEKEIKTHKALPSPEKLKKTRSSYVFTLYEAEEFAKEYFRTYYGGAGWHFGLIKHFVDLLYSKFDKPYGISFQDLRTMIGAIKEPYENPNDEDKYLDENDEKYHYLDKPKTAVPYKMEKEEYKFTIREVEYIVHRYFFAG